MGRLSKYATTITGFAIAAAVFAVLFWYIGYGRIARALGGADLGLVAVVAALMVGWIVVQGIALWIVLSIIDVAMSAASAVLVFASAAFANNVTPFGQAGGEPITALLISDISDAEFERSLAGIASADALNFVPSTSLGLVGVGVYATTTTLGPRLRFAAGSVVAFSTLLVGLATVIWYRRDAVEALVVRVATPPLQFLGRVVPRVSVPQPEAIQESFDRFFESIDRLLADPRGLALALVASTLGMALQASAMWLTFEALGAPIPYYVPYFVIPVGTMAAIGPTPGGLGGIESAHILLLSSLTSASAPVVAAAVIIHRIGGFWLTMTIGGGSMASLQARERLT
jgi:uncharacterized protein (TIRG00374 family)